MVSNGPQRADRRGYADGDLLWHLFSPKMLWLAWFPLVVIGVLHYSTGSHHHWIHDVLRRLYYVPILFAAFTLGSRGGCVVALVASFSYAPHAFFLASPSHDPESTLNKALEILLYNTIGIMAGVLADRELKRRKQVERAYAKQQRMAEQLIRAGRLAALGELVAGIAHELKNPLHTIKGTAEIVDEVISKDCEQAQMWMLMKQEIVRMERIAEGFLSFARPSRVALTPLCLEALYSRASDLLLARVKSAPGVRLVVDGLCPVVGVQIVRVDRDQLTQAALNIASNALSAMGGRGRLQLSLSLRDEDDVRRALLRIENDGPAIDKEDIERIFDPFYSRSENGTGLGLPIAERIVEAHGGFIRVQNILERRAVAFTILLPVETPPEERPT